MQCTLSPSVVPMSKPRHQPSPAPAIQIVARPVWGLHRLAWPQLRAFSGLGPDATYLWPRWLFLRAVGLVFVLIFSGILREGGALVGPDGLAPLVGADQCTTFA